ncbi:MAG: methyl-accepting chemotaxis protein [Rhodocyclaceae bacterium]|nr:methyl-accepting chemotaxis protein [Rhodocyclaceae bacterium]
MTTRHTSVALKLSMVLAVCITALLLSASFGLAHYLTGKLEQKSLDGLQANNRLIINMIDGYNSALEQSQQRLGQVFAGYYPDAFTLDAASGVLMHGNVPINFNETTIPDRFTQLSGVVATVLTRKGNDFERTSTSIKNEKGERASGVPLGTDHPAVAKLLLGETYTGKAKMLGRDFMTHYIPIRDAGNQVIGGFFVGVDFTEGLAALKKKVLALKIGQTGYPYALDLGRDKGQLVIHPAKEGETLLGTKDAKGNNFVDEMIAKRDGIINYWWKNPGEDETREKVVVFNHYPAWNWLIASGSYLDEFNSEGKETGRGLMLLTLLLIPLILGIVWFLSRRWIAIPLRKAVEQANRVAEGDFTMPVMTYSRDEIGALMKAQFDMSQRLGHTINEVRAVAASVASDATQLTGAASRVADGSSEQSDAASSMAAAVEQMSTSIDMIADHAHNALAVSNDAQGVSLSSSETISQAVSAMNSIADTVRNSSEAIQQLGRESQEISAIAGTIKEIAEQTNLLALNAAIEAARAGEQGRGFAVVADEVRKLAERTAKSTFEIASMISSIQSGTQTAVNNMNIGVEQVASGVNLAAEANQAIRRIHDNAVKVSNAVASISAAIREQSVATTSVAQGLEQIARMTERNNADAQDTAGSAQALQDVAGRLRGTVEAFKV